MRINGIVVHGNKRGRVLGFPTANISLEGLEEIDAGVYAGKVMYREKEYFAGVYIHGHKPLLEAHLLDFDGDIYGETLRIELGKIVRGAEKFETDEELIAAISSDIEEIRKTLTKL